MTESWKNPTTEDILNALGPEISNEDFDNWLDEHDQQVRADEREKIAAAIRAERDRFGSDLADAATVAFNRAAKIAERMSDG